MTDAAIITDPQILCGKPVIAGTRISVELILDKLGAGDSIPEILLDYPHLNRDQILSAIRYASYSLRNQSVSTPSSQVA